MSTRADAHRKAYEGRTARRRFLMKTLGLGAAGLAVGGLGAWTKEEMASGLGATTTVADLKLQLDSVTAARAALELSHSALQAQAAEWAPQLAAANAQNSQLSSSLVAAQREAADLAAQVASLQAAIEQANTRLARSGELAGLYEQLDAAGLDGVVQTGLAAVSGAMASLTGPALLLRAGVASARGLLGTFEAVLPDFRGAMAWMGEQVVRLKVGLWAVESASQQTINSAMAGVAASFGGFAAFLLDHLPFNIGATVKRTLAATQDVLTQLTQMTDKAGDEVLLKISRHVDDGPHDWKRTLVTPLRDNTLAAADQVIGAVDSASSTFAAALEAPAASALETRRQLRQQIANHRAAHGL